MISIKLSKYFKGILFLFLPVLFFSCTNASNQKSNSKQINDTQQASVDSSNWLIPNAGIRSILDDSRGNLWFASTDFVCMFDGEKTTYFSEDDGLAGPGSLHEDVEGTVWVVDGFHAYSYDGKRFNGHPLIPDTSGNVWNVKTTDLWFKKGMRRLGNTEGPPGIYRNRDGKIEFLAFPLSPTDKDDSRYYPTTGALKGKDGTIWFGTMEIVVGYKDGVFTLIDRKKMGRMDDPNHIGIRGLFIDSKGKLWMADNGSGYFVYDGDSVINFPNYIIWEKMTGKVIPCIGPSLFQRTGTGICGSGPFIRASGDTIQKPGSLQILLKRKEC